MIHIKLLVIHRKLLELSYKVMKLVFEFRSSPPPRRSIVINLSSLK